VAAGAGEILVQSIDRDGRGEGYDLELVEAVACAASVPVICCGGVGSYEHYAEGIRAGASAAAAANIWHFKELSDRNGKRALAKAGVNVRL
jgi:imidazole glycerol-phosphate synthase subunit HisF